MGGQTGAKWGVGLGGQTRRWTGGRTGGSD